MLMLSTMATWRSRTLEIMKSMSCTTQPVRSSPLRTMSFI